MRTFVLSLVLVTLGSAGVRADHQLTALRHQYESQRDALEADYRAQLDQARYAYHRQRDQLLHARRQIARVACHRSRAAAYRENSRALAEAAKCFAASNREIGCWVRRERDRLRDAYEAERRLVRHVGLRGNEYGHARSCSCTTCRPPLRQPNLPQPPLPQPPLLQPSHRERPWDFPSVPHQLPGSRKVDWTGVLLRLLFDG